MFNLQTITIKCESFIQCFFSFCFKKVNKKGKQKEKGIKKIVSSSIKNPNLANVLLVLESGISHFLGLCNIYQRQS